MTVESRRVRPYLLALFACLSLGMIAATPAFTIVPTVIVYPLATSASIDREITSRITTTLANQIAQGGSVKVVPAQTDVDRANYLADARSVGANYYVTGFMTPLGNGASVVEQVVSTTSGTLVFSVTNYITNLTDIAAQGDQLRAAIVDRSTRGIQAFQAPPPPEDTPTPSTEKGAETSLNRLFSHKKSEPSAAEVAIAPPANATIAILTVGGSSSFDQRTAAAKAIASAFEHQGRHAVIVNASGPSNGICTGNKATSQVAAWLDTPPPNNTAGASTLRLIAYDCSGNVAFDRTFKEPLASVTDSAVGAYLAPKRRA